LPTPHPLVTRLVELETLKTWSLIVTLFGDLDGDVLTGAEIRTLLGHIGIKPEAIRVALHRLKSDGWVDAEKQGREAVYRLSEMGRRETSAVTADVYRRDVKHPDGWHVLLVKDGTAPDGAISLTREVFLTPKSEQSIPLGVLALSTAGGSVPQWVEEALVPLPMQNNAAALVQVLSSAERDGLSKTDAVSLRLLTVHHWRRLALRSGIWAHIALLPNGVLARCHSIVTQYLETAPISGPEQ